MPRGPARSATYEAAPNIALVKYWGMRDEARGLPFNSSLSVTLDHLRTRTTVQFVPTLGQDEFVLNGEPISGAPQEHVSRFLDIVRREAREPDRARVRSTNNFQTASGLASSASGFAALAGAAAEAAGLHRSPRRLSQLARLGSGSASRSIFGGFVEWRRGEKADGSDCYARPLFPETHWPGLVDLVALVRAAPTKAVRSAQAMQRTVETSPRYAARLREVPRRIRGMRRAISRRDADALFPLVIEECDSFREVCETTIPALDYLTPASREVLKTVLEVNRASGRAVAGYTHDAGAHVHLFTLERDAAALKRRIGRVPGVERVLELHAGPGGRLIAGAG